MQPNRGRRRCLAGSGYPGRFAMRLRRPLLSSAAALIALSTLAGFAARAEDAPQTAAPKAESGQPAAPPTQNTAALVNGALDVPGAPTDSQTVPAKFSKRNDAIDHVPIMAMPVL